MLTLNEQELKELDKFLQEMPLKYGLPLLNYLNEKIKASQANQNVELEKTE
jgi:hypothetical protein